MAQEQDAAARDDVTSQAHLSIAEYRLIRPVGRGSYGEVWLGQSILGEYRAIKIVRRNKEENTRPYDRELSGICRFEPISRSHPGYVAILHVGMANDYFYYVMELADDVDSTAASDTFSAEKYQPKTLASELRRTRRFPVQQSLEIALKLIEVLEDLHGRGLVHRDLKPSNIIFVNNLPKLADVGLITNSDANFSFVGTEGYVPPEGPGTPQADLYAFGKVLYEMFSGHPRDHFPNLRTDIRECPDSKTLLELNAVILRLCGDANTRSRLSAAAVRTDLAHIQQGISVRSRMRLSRLRKVALPFVVSAVLVLIVLSASRRMVALWKTPIFDLVVVSDTSALPKLSRHFSRAVTEHSQDFADLKVLPFRHAHHVNRENIGTQTLTNFPAARNYLVLSTIQSNDAVVLSARLHDRKARETHHSTYSFDLTNSPGVALETISKVRSLLHRKPLTAARANELRTALERHFRAREFFTKGEEAIFRTGQKEDLRLAIRHFSAAIELCPYFIEAYLSLGRTYRELAAFDRDPQEIVAEWKDALTRALQIDDTCAEIYTALAGIYYLYDWNWAAARSAFQKACVLDPSIHRGNEATFLRCMGELRESRPLAERLISELPNDRFSLSGMIIQLRLERNYQESLAVAEKMERLYPGRWIVSLLQAMTFYELSNFNGAEERLKRALEIDNNPELLGWLGAVYAETDRPELARQIVTELERLISVRYVNPYFIAAVQAALGRSDDAFSWLEKAFEDRSENLINAEWGGLHTDPRLRKIRDDSRFAGLLGRIKLPAWPQRR